MTTPKQLDALIDFIVQHLPDSVEARINRLEALLDIVPEDYPRQQDLVKMLMDLKAHDLHQLQFKITV